MKGSAIGSKHSRENPAIGNMKNKMFDKKMLKKLAKVVDGGTALASIIGTATEPAAELTKLTYELSGGKGKVKVIRIKDIMP